MTNSEIKQELIQSLFDRGIYTKQVNDVEYRTRCPFCGDSDNINTGHLYIRINPKDNFPIMYNCFRCEARGVLKADSLSLLEIDDVDLKSQLHSLNKTSDKIDNKNISSNPKTKYFDYKIPGVHIGVKTKYIEDRLGKKLSVNDFKEMKVVTSLKEFLVYNKIKELTFPKNICNMLEKCYVGFLSFGNSHILFRDITNTQEIKWIKYPITKESSENRIFYSLATSIDPLTPEPLVLNLAEGVMDILSVKHNLGYDKENMINICVSGKYYDRMLLYLIDLGLVGSNITVNIFSDNDAKFNKKKNNVPTTIQYYQKILKNYKHLYGEVNVYYNLIGKDVGVPIDEISLTKYKL